MHYFQDVYNRFMDIRTDDAKDRLTPPEVTGLTSQT